MSRVQAYKMAGFCIILIHFVDTPIAYSYLVHPCASSCMGLLTVWPCMAHLFLYGFTDAICIHLFALVSVILVNTCYHLYVFVFIFCRVPKNLNSFNGNFQICQAEQGDKRAPSNAEIALETPVKKAKLTQEQRAWELLGHHLQRGDRIMSDGYYEADVGQDADPQTPPRKIRRRNPEGAGGEWYNIHVYKLVGQCCDASGSRSHGVS